MRINAEIMPCNCSEREHWLSRTRMFGHKSSAVPVLRPVPDYNSFSPLDDAFGAARHNNDTQHTTSCNIIQMFATTTARTVVVLGPNPPLRFSSVVGVIY